jgi:hypothetical protein
MWQLQVHCPPRLLTAVSFRTLNGLGILVCSMDGSVAFLDFSQDELGDPLSEEEKVGLWPMCYDTGSENLFNWVLFLWKTFLNYSK